MSRLRVFMATRDGELLIIVDRRLRSVCFAGVQNWTDAALHRLLAFALVWKLAVDVTMLFPHCHRR